MKSLTRIEILARNHDGEAPSPVCVVDFPVVGDIKIILSRDAMGVLALESTSALPNPEYAEQLLDLADVLRVLHEQMSKTSIASQHASTELFAMNKWIPQA